jgi:hypothetical protein
MPANNISNSPQVEVFVDWLQGPYRSHLTYHIGNLDQDRMKDPEVDYIGRMAWHAYEVGKIELVQRREREGRYQYIAQKRRFPDKRREQLWRTKQITVFARKEAPTLEL